MPWHLATGKWLVIGSTSPAAGLALNCLSEAAVVVNDSSVWHGFSCRLHPLTTRWVWLRYVKTLLNVFVCFSSPQQTAA